MIQRSTSRDRAKHRCRSNRRSTNQQTSLETEETRCWPSLTLRKNSGSRMEARARRKAPSLKRGHRLSTTQSLRSKTWRSLAMKISQSRKTQKVKEVSQALEVTSWIRDVLEPLPSARGQRATHQETATLSSYLIQLVLKISRHRIRT